MLAAVQLRESHRRINIIEGCHTSSSLSHPGPNGDSVGTYDPTMTTSAHRMALLKRSRRSSRLV